ncbi:hypothetical protein IHE55_23465 [Streptomyces pactum]|uniref:Uncharacterized protein n=1 Tax=Streptomyces pactum TaxID=68249 RepID=A0ABS0NQT6_9ACTN|nr:hypothetical protein [Streptomyces pactum]MBH5337565.1 hypothetical protein [Streptomyces pactum]
MHRGTDDRTPHRGPVHRGRQGIRRAAAHPVVRELALVLLHAAVARLERDAPPGPARSAPAAIGAAVARALGAAPHAAPARRPDGVCGGG